MAPRKANRPTLTRQQIVDAAIGLVDREGLEALTMRKLASALGMSPMSLYYHVRDKSALYDLILDAVMDDVDLTVDDGALPLEERLARMAHAFRAALLAHPRATVIAMGRSMRTPAQLRPIEAMLGVLLGAGLSPAEAMRAVNVIGQYVIGTTALYANHLTESEYHDDGVPGIEPADFPNLLTAMSAGGEGAWDEDFEAGLRALIGGLVTGGTR